MSQLPRPGNFGIMLRHCARENYPPKKKGTEMDDKNNNERIEDNFNRGLVTNAEATIEQVLDERLIILNRFHSADFKKILDDAVKSFKLGHIRGIGDSPEVYFHPNFKYLAINEMNRYSQNIAYQNHLYAKFVRLKAANAELVEHAGKVMELLKEHGPSIVPHLMDTDDNAGQYLRDALAKAKGDD